MQISVAKFRSLCRRFGEVHIHQCPDFKDGPRTRTKKSDTASAKCGISAGSDLISVRVLPVMDFCHSDRNHSPARGVILGRNSKLHRASVVLSHDFRRSTAKMSWLGAISPRAGSISSGVTSASMSATPSIRLPANVSASDAGVAFVDGAVLCGDFSFIEGH